MQFLLKRTLRKLQHVGGKARNHMAVFGLFGWCFSFERGDKRDVFLFGKLFGAFLPQHFFTLL